MYYGLIYTRCGAGFSDLRKRFLVKEEGQLFYACSKELSEDNVDVALLEAVARIKYSSSEDDTYAYIVPDYGNRILLNSHPVPYDVDAIVSYAHRPGNFINQAYVGGFEDMYPYESFGSGIVWDAKARGEEYYYENDPCELEIKNDFARVSGSISIGDIARFVSDGRRDVLKKVIAYILSQYSIKQEERKYLVIRETNTRNVELWVAAIERAFSPRMASGLSFATGMNRHTATNKYTVDSAGKCQENWGMYGGNQRIRNLAMLVGVTDEDNERVTAYSPYVLLDGVNKQFSVEIEAKKPFYQFVTSFSDEHAVFCKEFLQMIDFSYPTEEVHLLYSSYKSLQRYWTSKSVKDFLAASSIISRFPLKKTKYLERIYYDAKASLNYFGQEDDVSSLEIVRWLNKVSVIVGDSKAKGSFSDYLRRRVADRVSKYP